jgi:hypothetical protein
MSLHSHSHLGPRLLYSLRRLLPPRKCRRTLSFPGPQHRIPAGTPGPSRWRTPRLTPAARGFRLPSQSIPYRRSAPKRQLVGGSIRPSPQSPKGIIGSFPPMTKVHFIRDAELLNIEHLLSLCDPGLGYLLRPQWRICFVLHEGHCYDVEIVDYH